MWNPVEKRPNGFHYQDTPGLVKTDLQFLKELYKGQEVLEFWWSQIYYKIMMHQLIHSQMEGILWLKLANKLTSQKLCLCVCYVPPSSSSIGVIVQNNF